MEAGRPKDYATYRELVGEITGLTLAITEIESLLKHIEKANDD